MGITIKFDILALAGLYFLAWVNRSNWKRVTIATTAISVVGIATFALLVYCRSGGFDGEGSTSHFLWVRRLYWQFCAYPVQHPAVLAFASLFCIAPMGLRSRNRFALASFLYGVFLLFLFAKSAKFTEIRAQMGIMLLLMPLVLIALDRIFRSENEHRAALRQHDSAVPQSVG